MLQRQSLIIIIILTWLTVILSVLAVLNETRSPIDHKYYLPSHYDLPQTILLPIHNRSNTQITERMPAFPELEIGHVFCKTILTCDDGPGWKTRLYGCSRDRGFSNRGETKQVQVVEPERDYSNRL